MRRVHFINRFFNPDHSATSQILTGIAIDLVRQGHEVHVVTSRQLYENAKASLPAEEILDGVHIHRVATTRFGRSGILGRAADYFSFYLGAARALWRTVRPGDVVVAKTDPPLIALAAAPVAYARGARFVNWLQDVFPEVATGLNLGGAGGRLVFGPLRGLRNRNLRRAHSNVAIGERMADHLAGQGVPRDRITIIPNWADASLVAPVAEADNTLRRAWGLEGKLVVGYSGNLGRVHDVDTIVEAIAEVQRRQQAGRLGREVAFLFIGGGAKRRQLEKEIGRRALESVVLKPYQPEAMLAEALSTADVHLVSLLPEIEGLVVPSKMYGIMAAGRPTIFVGAEDGEIARLVRRHGCGVAVGIGDGAGLADAVEALAADEAGRAAMGDAARAAFLAAYTRQVSALSWHTLLTGLYAPEAGGRETAAWKVPEPARAERG